MIPVDQEHLHDPENGSVGDCFRACLASLLEVPIAAVPHFALLGSRWQRVLDGYLAGLSREIEWAEGVPPDDVWAIATVQSPRSSDVKHSVIWRNGQIVHDPHPSRAGGEGPLDYFYLIPDLPSPHAPHRPSSSSKTSNWSFDA